MGAEEELQQNSNNNNKRVKIFTYGTLKKGFSNHSLLEEMMSTGDAVYMGVYRTAEKLPLVCGPYRVPFLLNFPGLGSHVWGEVYAVSSRALASMDELEGTTRGHYRRLPLKVVKVVVDDHHHHHHQEQEQEQEEVVISVEAYYAHTSYAEALWKRNGEKGYTCYSQKEAHGYVKRKDRPQHLTFLDQIQLFVSCDPPFSVPPPPPPVLPL